MQRFLIALGVVAFIGSLIWPWLSLLPFGRLPGDIVIRRAGFTIHLPLATSLLISLLLTLFLWLWRK